MYGGIGDGIEKLFWTMLVLLILFVPFGIWKICELVSTFFSHIRWV